MTYQFNLILVAEFLILIGVKMNEDMIGAKDIREFCIYLKDCTDSQVSGVYEKEKKAGRSCYAELALNEMNWRKILHLFGK